MKVRYLLAGVLVVLELPVLLSLAAGAFVAGIFAAVAMMCSWAARVDVGLFLRGAKAAQSSGAEVETGSHPDQNSAAAEHAIMQGVTRPPAELPEDPVATVANVDFPLVLRGYHRDAVDEYVRRAAALVAELYAGRSPEGAVRGAFERVGEQVSSILARAQETAGTVASDSRAEAEQRLIQARAEAEELERGIHALADERHRGSEQEARGRERAAEIRVHELDADVDRVWAERTRMVSDVRKLAEELSELAGVAATRFPAATAEAAAVVRGARDRRASPETDPEVPAPGERESPTAGPDLAGEATEMSSGYQAASLEGPADMPDDKFATRGHKAPTDDLGAGARVTQPERLTVEPAAALPDPSTTGGNGSRVRVTFELGGHVFLRDRGYRFRAAFHKRGPGWVVILVLGLAVAVALGAPWAWVVLVLGLAAAVALGALIAG